MAEDLVVRGIRLDTADLERGSRKSVRELERIDREIEKVERDARSADQSLGNFGRTLRNIGAGVGGLLVVQRALRNFERGSRFIFNTNVELQRLDALLGTVTGSARRGEAAFDMITRFAIETPFEIQNLTTAFVDLRARGVVPTEERLRGLGNVSAAFQGDITELSQAVISGANGMSRPLRRFGFDMEINGDRAVVSFQGVRREIGLNVEELSAFVAEMGNTGRFATAMEDQMGTLGGALSNLDDSLSKIAKTIGDQGLNDELVETIRLLDETIGNADDFAAAVGGTMAAGIRTLREGLAEVKPLLEFVARFSGGALGTSRVPDFSSTVERAMGQEDDLMVVARAQGELRRQVEAFRAAEAALQNVANAESAGRPNILQRFGATPFAASVPAIMGGLERVAPDALAQFGLQGEGRSAGDVLNDVRAVRRELEQSFEAVKQRRDVLALGPDEGFTEGGGGSGGRTGRTEKLSEFEKIMERLESGRREIAAMEAALEGTSIEFDATEESAALLEQTVRALAAVGTEQANAVLPPLVAQYVEYATALEEAERRAKALEAAEREMQKLRDATSGTRGATAEKDREARRAEEIEKEARALEDAAMRAAENVGDAFVDMITSADDVADAFGNMVSSIIADLVRLASQQLIVEPLFNLFMQILGGASGGGSFTAGGVTEAAPLGPHGVPRAAGGPVSAGRSYLVGERGPERFIPSEMGVIQPNHGLGGGPANVMNVQLVVAPEFRTMDLRTGAEDAAAELIPHIVRGLEDAKNLPGWRN